MVSCVVYNDKGTGYYAKISYSEGWWRVFNASRREIIREGKSLNKNVLRRAVRRELIKLGVKFEFEFTKKGFAITKEK